MSNIQDDGEETIGTVTSEGGSSVYTNTTLGCTFPVRVPASADEFDRLAGKPGACVEEAIRNVIYRSVNHDFRQKLCEALEAETGVARARKLEGEGDKAKEVFAQTEKEYVASLKLSGVIDQDQIQLIANSVAAELVFDPSPSKRRGGPSKEILAAADGILQALNVGQTQTEIVAAKFAARLGIPDFTAAYGEVSEASLIQALVALEEKEKRERVAGLI